MTAQEWRVGSKITLNVYEGDRPVCQCHSSEDAERIVAAVNLQSIGLAINNGEMMQPFELKDLEVSQRAYHCLIRGFGLGPKSTLSEILSLDLSIPPKNFGITSFCDLASGFVAAGVSEPQFIGSKFFWTSRKKWRAALARRALWNKDSSAQVAR